MVALSDQLYAAWEMGESSGNRADSTANATTLTDNNTVASGTGLVNALAADFEDTNTEYLSAASNSNIQAGDIDHTFEVWVKFESLSTLHCLFGKKNNFFEDYSCLYYSVEGQVGFSAAGQSVFGGGSVSTGTWYQYIMWHDATANQIGIARNAGSATTVGTGGTAPDVTTGDLNVGRRPVNADWYFDGLMGPLRYWKRVLTSDERTELYNSGSGRTYSYIAGASGLSIPVVMNQYRQRRS